MAVDVDNHFDNSLVSRDPFIVFFMLYLLIWGRRSSGAVPFATMFSLLVLWFGISVPLVFLGAFIAVRKNRYTDTLRGAVACVLTDVATLLSR